MRAIAREFNQSETTFLLRPGITPWGPGCGWKPPADSHQPAGIWVSGGRSPAKISSIWREAPQWGYLWGNGRSSFLEDFGGSREEPTLLSFSPQPRRDHGDITSALRT